jgi:hypothetical protein
MKKIHKRQKRELYQAEHPAPQSLAATLATGRTLPKPASATSGPREFA